MRSLFGGTRSSSVFVTTYVRPRIGDRILDIGCGPGDIVTYLPKVDYVGFDSNEAYIRSAQSRFGSRGTFFCRKIGEDNFEGENEFDIVLALGILHHLDDDEAISLFRLAWRVLRKGGRLLTFDGCYVKNQPMIIRWLLSKDRGQYVRTEEQYMNLSHKTFRDVEVRIHHDLLRIPYTILIMECTKGE